jgi:hypothetical protein
VLASEGLGYVLENNLLMVARTEDLAAFDRARGRTYAGHRIALRFHDGLPYPGMLPKASTREERRKDPTARVRFPGLFATAFQDIWGFRFEPDPDLQGRLNLRLTDRPAMEVLDLILASLDAAAVRLPDEDGKAVLRIRSLAAAGDEALDLSKDRTGAGPALACPVGSRVGSDWDRDRPWGRSAERDDERADRVDRDTQLEAAESNPSSGIWSGCCESGPSTSRGRASAPSRRS